MEKRRPRVRDHVIYHDEHGNPHKALVTCVFDQSKSVEDSEGNMVEKDGRYVTEPMFAEDDLSELPCLNIVYVSDDEARDDSYGRQIVRETSQVHKLNMQTHGHYWRFPWEEPNPVAVPSEK